MKPLTAQMGKKLLASLGDARKSPTYYMEGMQIEIEHKVYHSRSKSKRRAYNDCLKIVRKEQADFEKVNK